jgi:hypothetical protein
MKERMKKLYLGISTKQLEGIGVIEIILILVIIIGLVLIFRNQIEAIIKEAFDAINGNVTKIGEEIVVD